MNSYMRKTTSYLRNLAEVRARKSAEILQLERQRAAITEQIEKAQDALNAIDERIREFDSRINPDLIEPIHARKGRYGPRGALRANVIDYLKRVSPAEATTAEVSSFIEHTFGLTFQNRFDRERWSCNTIKSCLKQLMCEGRVERLHEASIRTTMGRWRWISPPTTIESVTETALRAGVALQHNTRRRGRPKASAAAETPAP